MLLSYFWQLLSVGQTRDHCQSPGNAVCYLSEFDMIVGGLCCPGSACLPYPGDQNNFCQQMEFLGEGEYCGNKVGMCEAGLNCIGNTCQDMNGILTPAPAPGTCQKPGDALCYFDDFGLDVGDPCCEGSECLVYPGDTQGNKFCQFTDKIAEGGFCGNRVGSCDAGLTCTDNLCTKETTFPPITPAPDTCRDPGDAICFLAEFGLTVGDPCCEGSTCQPYPYGGTKDSFCLYDEGIKEGESCANRVGVCENGLECTEDICTGPCQEPGNAICYLAAYDLVVGEPCCPGSECLPFPLDSVDKVDNFCQFLDPIKEGDSCGNKIGACDTGLTCTDDICTKGTPAPTEPPTKPPPACAAHDAICFSINPPVTKACCDPETYKCKLDPTDSPNYTCQN